MGVDIEVWRARIGLFNGGKGRLSKPSRANLCCGHQATAALALLQTGLALLVTVLFFLWRRNTKTAHSRKTYSGPETAITLELLGDVLAKLYDARTNWFNIGLALKVDYNHLDSIRKEYREKDSDCLREMLAQRLQTGGPLTWKMLCDCLRQPMVGRNDTADRIEQDIKDRVSTVSEILSKLHDARSSWFNIGLVLEVDYNTLDSIRKENHGYEADCFREMLAHRLRTGDPLTWTQLCHCLRQPTVGRNDVADKIDKESKQQSNPPSQDHGPSVGAEQEAEQKMETEPSTLRPENSHAGRNIRKSPTPCEEELEQDSMEIQKHFNDLVWSIYRSLDIRKIAKEAVLTSLMGFGCLKKVFKGRDQCVFRAQKKKLAASETVEKIWLIISDYFSYFDYEMIEQIADKLGTDADKQNVDAYKGKFAEYAKRRIVKTKIGSKCEEDSTDMLVKLDSTYDGCEIGRLKRFEIKLCEILGLNQGTIKLCTIDDGCVELTFQIPSFITSDVFPLSAHQEAALQREGVLQLHCGDYHYPAEGERTMAGSTNPKDPRPRDPPAPGQTTTPEAATVQSESLKSTVVAGVESSTANTLKSQLSDYNQTFVRQPTVQPKFGSQHSRSDSGISKTWPGAHSITTEVSKLNREDEFLSHTFSTAEPAHLVSNEPPPLVKVSSSKLHSAVFNGEFSKVRLLVEVLNCSPLAVNREGHTALHMAAACGNLEMVKYLIEDQLINPAVESIKELITPLHCAAFYGHLHIVEYLVGTQQVDPLVLDESKHSPVHAACEAGYFDTVMYLISESEKHQPFDFSEVMSDGSCYLHLAAKSNNPKLVEFFLSEGRNEVDAKDKNANTALSRASVFGSLEAIKVLLNRGAFINSPNKHRTTSLSQASFNGHHEVVNVLIQAGATVNILNKFHKTPLYGASLQGHLKTVECLIQAGADVNVQGNNGPTALMAAAQNGHLRVVELLIASKALVNLKTQDKKTALHLASTNGHHEVVRVLLTAGATVNTQDHNGATALLFSSIDGHLSTVEILIAAKADINLEMKDKSIPLHFASYFGFVEVVQALIAAGSLINYQNKLGQTPFWMASYEGHLEVMELLIKHGAEVNEQSKDGRTALHNAAQHNHLRVVETLIAANALVSVESKMGNTPLHLASGKGNAEIVQVLLASKAILNTQNRVRDTPLTLACDNGHEKIVQMLIDAGADVNEFEVAMGGKTILAGTASKGHVGVVNTLIAAKAQVNTCNKYNETAIHAASYKGHHEVVQILIEAGATINNPNKDGETPLHEASKQGHYKVIRVLIDAGATVNTQKTDKQFGVSPLWTACDEGHDKVVELLLEAGADTSAKWEKYGTTPLIVAAKKGHVRIAKHLIAAKADLDAQDIVQNTALHAACDPVLQNLKEQTAIAKTEITKALITAGASLNIQNRDLRTPLMVAANASKRSINSKAIVELLLSNGADPTIKNRSGDTAYELSRYRDRDPEIRELLRNVTVPK